LRIREIKLDANTSSDDVAKLNAVFGLKDEIPPIGPLQGKAQISGDDQNLVIDGISMAAGQEDLLLVKLSGRLGKLSAANTLPENWATASRNWARLPPRPRFSTKTKRFPSTPPNYGWETWITRL
jgi:hypothetical protein